MRWLLPSLLFLLLPLRADDLARIESLTGQWMALRLQRAQEAGAWKEESARLRMERTLLEEAEQRLRAELDALRADASDTEALQADVLEELRDRKGRESLLERFLTRSEALLRDLIENMPAPLRTRLEDEYQGMDAAGNEALPRFRALLSLHNRLLHVQTEVFITTMMIEVEGQRREMEVLWIGQAAAYAVSPDQQVAARSLHGLGPVGWEILPGKGPRIREALAVVRREKPPVLLSLPVAGQR